MNRGTGPGAGGGGSGARARGRSPGKTQRMEEPWGRHNFSMAHAGSEEPTAAPAPALAQPPRNDAARVPGQQPKSAYEIGCPGALQNS